MKKIILTLVFATMIFPLTLFADNYSSLWKQIEEARSKDLPKTELQLLEKIVKKVEFVNMAIVFFEVGYFVY